MKKKLIFEVEEGTCEDCARCPFDGTFDNGDMICETLEVDCQKYDLSTLKFIGEEDENSLLTEWHDPECPPDNKRQVLLKVKTSFIDKIYYKVGSFIDGDYCESYSGRPLKTECLGWREIHE